MESLVYETRVALCKANNSLLIILPLTLFKHLERICELLGMLIIPGK